MLNFIIYFYFLLYFVSPVFAAEVYGKENAGDVNAVRGKMGRLSVSAPRDPQESLEKPGRERKGLKDQTNTVLMLSCSGTISQGPGLSDSPQKAGGIDDSFTSTVSGDVRKERRLEVRSAGSSADMEPFPMNVARNLGTAFIIAGIVDRFNETERVDPWQFIMSEGSEYEREYRLTLKDESTIVLRPGVRTYHIKNGAQEYDIQEDGYFVWRVASSSKVEQLKGRKTRKPKEDDPFFSRGSNLDAAKDLARALAGSLYPRPIFKKRVERPAFR